jgi:antitoxin component YwqK of YwqJK toxin-antitoxin module/peroxiredoxin
MRIPLILSCLILTACGPLVVRSLYPNGTVMAEGATERRKQTGPWTYFYETGAKQAAGSWILDKQDGPWTWWYPDGKPQHRGSYSDHGLRTGVWESWHADGSVAATGSYRLDRQDGLWTYAHPGGASFAAGTFELGVKHGWWFKLAADGKPVESGLYVKGLKVGPWTTWQDGTATVADLGVPQGHAASWEGRIWHLKGPQTATISFASDGRPEALTLSGDGRILSTLASVPASCAADLSAIIPQVRPAIPDLPAAVPALTAVSSPVPASAPVQATSEAQIETTSGGLSPTPVIPTVLAKGDMANIPTLIKAYTSGRDPLASDSYEWGTPTTNTAGDPAGRKLLGKRLPQNRFLSSTGSVIDLTRLGKPVVVCVMRGFSGQVCIYCATQTAAIANNYRRFTDAGAEVVIIYPGPTEAVPAFVQAVQSLRKDPPPMPIGLDVSLLLVRGLGVEENLAKPTSLILDRDGNVAYSYVGASMSDRPSVEDLLKALAKVQK